MPWTPTNLSEPSWSDTASISQPAPRITSPSVATMCRSHSSAVFDHRESAVFPTETQNVKSTSTLVRTRSAKVLQPSRVVRFIHELLFTYRYFVYFAATLLLVDTMVSCFIIEFVPYSEVDFSTYMQQMTLFKAGERDYVRIRGKMGPVVYPAGFVYVFSALHSLTDGGDNIRLAQYTFLGFYLATIATIFAIYNRVRVTPPWVAVFVILSKRLHSIYILSMFNDGVAMMILFWAVYLFTHQKWGWGCTLFSFAVSVKMNVLLFAPALFFVLLQSCGLICTIRHLFLCAGIQVILALPFLRENWASYLFRAFEFSRMFSHCETMNWQFLPEAVFESRRLALLLLGCHIFFLILFVNKYFSVLKTVHEALSKPFSTKTPSPTRKEVVVLSMFAVNFVGIVFSRTMHTQFYSWYYPTLPLLLWNSDLPLLVRVLALAMSENGFNKYPATASSSLGLQIANVAVLLALYWTNSDLGLVGVNG